MLDPLFIQVCLVSRSSCLLVCVTHDFKKNRWGISDAPLEEDILVSHLVFLTGKSNTLKNKNIIDIQNKERNNHLQSYQKKTGTSS